MGEATEFSLLPARNLSIRFYRRQSGFTHITFGGESKRQVMLSIRSRGPSSRLLLEA